VASHHKPGPPRTTGGFFDDLVTPLPRGSTGTPRLRPDANTPPPLARFEGRCSAAAGGTMTAGNSTPALRRRLPRSCWGSDEWAAAAPALPVLAHLVDARDGPPSTTCTAARGC